MSVTRRTPIETLLFVSANIAAAFALLWQPDLVNSLGFDSASPSLLTAFTSLFLHANTIHLLGNMVFLAAVGPMVEAGSKHGRLAIVYLVGGLAGVGAHWALAPHAMGASAPLVGASGAVATCVAFFSIRYMRMRVPILPGINVSVISVTELWLGLQILGAFVRIGAPQGGAAPGGQWRDYCLARPPIQHCCSRFRIALLNDPRKVA